MIAAAFRKQDGKRRGLKLAKLADKTVSKILRGHRNCGIMPEMVRACGIGEANPAAEREVICEWRREPIRKGFWYMAERIYLSSPTMHGEEQAFIKEAFDTNWVAPLGKNVDEFEREMASYVGVKHAAALTAGTAALHLAVKLAGVKRGDKVFCSDLTFSATVNPVSYEGGEQVFIESERETWNMDPRALERAFEKYPACKCVIAANLYGTPAKLDELAEICAAHGAVLIEDAAESLGASYQGRMTGTFGKYNVLSFNGNKIITTSGGGMLLSDDGEAVRKARFWATQAREPFPWYEHKEIGYNYRMSNIVAGIGRGQLLHLEEHLKEKERIYRAYEKGLADLPLRMNPYLPESRPNFWLSCVTLERDSKITPEQIRLALEAENIETRPIWKPMHLQPVFAGNELIGVGDNVGEDIFARGLCLASDIKMSPEQQDRVISVIRGLFT